MNEQANKILIDLLQRAASGVDAAVSFSQAQVPDIIRQLMVWKAAAYGMRILFIRCAVKPRPSGRGGCQVAISPRVHPVIPQGAEMA
ncbi:TPA: hypothetical protein MJA81_23810 [Klebsiella pneumoniae]|nr:hypothetical protein [Klebsiella pneumoniae]HBY9803309.1 hypothetical protein [Klebsiella pneumoniae]